MSYLARLADIRWRLLNSYGHGAYWDGLITQKIAEVERQIAEHQAKKV